MKKKTLKYDILFLACLLIACACLFLLRNKQEGTIAKITCKDEIIGYYDLTKEETININNHNILKIENNEIYMLEATCPDKLCIKQGHIHETGASIVCLPHQVIVEIVEGKEGQNDAQVY